jgi:hypothetical protein
LIGEYIDKEDSEVTKESAVDNTSGLDINTYSSITYTTTLQPLPTLFNNASIYEGVQGTI